MLRIAYKRDGSDHYPIEFRHDCERTYYDRLTGENQSMYEVIHELDDRGYDLISYDEFKDLTKEKLCSQNQK